MSTPITSAYAGEIVVELRKLPSETEWVEFKLNWEDKDDIGKYVSALANSAALAGKTKGYLVWGVDDATHELRGTAFSPTTKKVGGEVFENWLLRMMDPKVDFQFVEALVEGARVVLLVVERAFRNPVRFQSEGYIRVGSVVKKLKDVAPKERELFKALDQTPFEGLVAAERLRPERVLSLLDYPAYFRLLDLPLPTGRNGIIDAFAADGLITRGEAGGWDVTNLAAALFAANIGDFGTLERKAVRVIQYRGKSRVDSVREQVGQKGYANGFAGLIGYINGRLPSNEQIGEAFRTQVPVYPELAIRELVANALIHQDLAIKGAGPMVEIFEDRIEITNPGRPLIEANRFLGTPPRSRNEALASMMRRLRICEERGSGIAKVVFQTEIYQLPAPIFEVVGDNTRAVLLSPRPLSKLDRDSRVRACYLHACLKRVQQEYLTNSSIRERFGIAKKNSAQASRIIREAVATNMIKAHDPDAAPKFMKYVPFWA